LGFGDVQIQASHHQSLTGDAKLLRLNMIPAEVVTAVVSKITALLETDHRVSGSTR
tara:strand:+ start:42 stop:209 length:168 start_codon:yes stop_codon:yes gene_type:complete